MSTVLARSDVLLSAFACDPNMGSEPYVGWKWLKLLLACDLHVTVITRRQHLAALEQACAGLGTVRFIAFDLPGMSKLDHRARLIKLYYIAWQLAAFFVALRRRVGIRWKFAMHVTYNVVDFPGFMWLLPRTRFVWGPVGGGQCPPRWSRVLYGASWWKQRVRCAIKQSLRWNPIVYLATRKADAVFVANAETEARLPAAFAGKYVRMLETAIDVELDQDHAIGERQAKVTFLWVGQLEPRKGLPLLLDALVAVRTRQLAAFDQMKVLVVGDGPDKHSLNQRAYSLGLSDRVTFLGKLRFDQMRQCYGSADAFVFTSVQDTSGNVVLEAIASGLPTIAFNHQGVAEMLDSGCAYLLSPTSYETAVEQLADSLVRVTTEPKEASAMGIQAKWHAAKRHSWESRRATFLEALHAIF
ncbi:MAG: hypothetical protein DI563_12415 [Variovorax paradoxus]|uniref:Glycosyl transferase family 1 domain-containing protein n=1 Tax=Variovorax paradoxus TaxID=34073 RepID=A0A2W5QCY2_VARPD|nr:MAG: hypothetical protein DI563_12415 [Variovorax paradoxus]